MVLKTTSRGGAQGRDGKKRNNPSDDGARPKVVDLGNTYKLDDLDAVDNCKECCKTVKDSENAIECDICKSWYHLECGKITEKIHDLMSKNASIDWYCQTCKNEIKTLKQENVKLKEENELLRKRLAAVEIKVEAIKTEIKEELLCVVNTKVQQILEDVKNVKEQDEKKLRENNLVLYNVPESEKNESNDRKNEDNSFCNKLFRNGVQINDFSIVQVIRLGKVRNDNRPRPLLVKCGNSREKWSILRNAKNLKHCSENLKKVIITPDMTKSERDVEKQLRDELREKRENGENDWYIKNKKLVKRNFQVTQ